MRPPPLSAKECRMYVHICICTVCMYIFDLYLSVFLRSIVSV